MTAAAPLEQVFEAARRWGLDPATLDAARALTGPGERERVTALAIQKEWDDAAQAFADALALTCSGDRDREPTIPEGRDRHAPGDLWCDLDDCVADDDAACNFAYGLLHAASGIAGELGVTILHRFPPTFNATEA